MGTGFRATFVISWAQTEVDGQTAAPAEMLVPGAIWRWTGTAIRVDGPQTMLVLEASKGVAELRRHAAQMVRRLVGAAISRNPDPLRDPRDMADTDMRLGEQGFSLTDGRRTWLVTLIAVEGTAARLLMFLGDPPPVLTELWVVQVNLAPGALAVTAPPEGGVICFAPGTRMRTATGDVRIDDLRPGDLLQTRDNGPCPVLWTGQRRMSGGRLYAMPHLRPVRFRAGALGKDRPDQDLWVSPRHRMLVRGDAARALFNTDEVLVAAEDLLNDRTITIDRSLHEVTYVHVLMEDHQIIWANGLETESFRPSQDTLETLDPMQRRRLLGVLPGLAGDEAAYGDPARRNLTGPEAAILRHDHVA